MRKPASSPPCSAIRLVPKKWSRKRRVRPFEAGRPQQSSITAMTVSKSSGRAGRTVRLLSSARFPMAQDHLLPAPPRRNDQRRRASLHRVTGRRRRPRRLVRRPWRPSPCAGRPTGRRARPPPDTPPRARPAAVHEPNGVSLSRERGARETQGAQETRGARKTQGAQETREAQQAVLGL